MKTSTTAPKPSAFFKISRVLPFITLIMFTVALVHLFIFRVTAYSITADSYRTALMLVLILGWLTLPLGLIATHIRHPLLRFSAWGSYIWMGLFNFLFLFSLIEFIIQFIYPHAYSYWVLGICSLIGLWSLHKGLSFPKVIFHSLHRSEIKGLRLVQISDLHVGMLHLNEKWLNRIVTTINELKPDIVAITGDLVEGDFLEISPQLAPLSQISATLDKFYITGNHEYIHHSGSWEERLQQLGFSVLHNQNKIISYKESRVLIAGVPDRMIGRFISGSLSLPDKALSTEESVQYKILLAHEPASVQDIKRESCDLILTGHTHGGQIFPFHFLVRLVQPVLKGFKRINGILVFAHQGTGFWGPPMRWFSRSEIVIFDWK